MKLFSVSQVKTIRFTLGRRHRVRVATVAFSAGAGISHRSGFGGWFDAMVGSFEKEV